MNLFVSGINHNTDENFAIKIDSETAIDIIDMYEDNYDTLAEVTLAKMDNLKASVYDSFTYMQDTDKISEMLSSGERFAVMFGDISFGVSGLSFEDAKEALDNQEF